MAFRTRLLATVAIPLIALTGMPGVSAAELLRPTAPAGAQSLVITVQADDDQQLLKQQKKERRENRRNQQDNANQAQQSDQEQVKPRRKKQNDDAQMQQDNANQAQQNDQEQVKPRRKKQNDDAQMQQDNADQSQQSDQEQVKPRRKKQQDNAASDQNQQGDDQLKNAIDNNNRKHRKQNAADDQQQMQQDNAGQTQQNDQEQVKPRRKKQNDNAQSDQTQQGDEQLKNAIDNNNNKRRKKQDAADEQQMQQDNANQAQQGDEEQVKPRRKKQQDNASEDQNQPTDDKLKHAIDNNKRKNNKNQDQAEQPADDNQAQSSDRKKVERPVDVKKAKDVAADPSKTADTVVLPVENGAAVLDSDKDADNAGADRNRRRQQREEVKQMPVPKSDKDAQRGFKEDKKIVIKPVLEIKGERIAGFKGYDDFGGRRIGDRDNRVVINIGGRVVIRSDDDSRIARNTEIRYERLPNNLIREVVIQPNGDRIVTVRNRYGEIVRRSRIERDNREVLIFYSPDLERGRDRLFLRDPGEDLPPMRLRIPVNDYIIDVSSGGSRNRNYEEFLDQPPVEQVERVYSVGEVKNSARIRDKMRRIDLDTITFETGSADVADDQVSSLKEVGAAIKDILDKDPGETFLIEGHTDAVGSDESNLVLSDQRAESIANVLSEAFDIPPENLVTQGYGERFLKIDSDGPERENRRVTIRRITPLVRPLESAEK